MCKEWEATLTEHHKQSKMFSCHYVEDHDK